MFDTASGHSIVLSAPPDTPIIVYFEPVGGEIALAPGQHVRLVVHGPSEETLEIAHEKDSITVWPSPKLTVKVYDMSGIELQILGF